MTATTSRSTTDTYSIARVAYIMDKVEDDLALISIRGFITLDKAREWREIVSKLLNMRAVNFFDLRFMRPDGLDCAIRYTVCSNGLISENSESGGFDLFLLPENTNVSIMVCLVKDEHLRAKAREYTFSKGWINTSSVFYDQSKEDRAFSKDGYGVQRAKLGRWS